MSVPEALEELHELLRICCEDSCPPRHVAHRYQICRTTLLSGELELTLPGFLTQCPSSIRFRDFVHLYHRHPRRRIKFIDQLLSDCRAKLNMRPVHERPTKPVNQSDLTPSQSSARVYTAGPLGRGSNDDFMDAARSGDDGFLWAEPGYKGSNLYR